MNKSNTRIKSPGGRFLALTEVTTAPGIVLGKSLGGTPKGELHSVPEPYARAETVLIEK